MRSPRIKHEADRIRGHTERRLMAGGFSILGIGGGALLWLRYGGTTAVIAVAIIITGAGILTLLWLLLSLMEVWAKGD